MKVIKDRSTILEPLSKEFEYPQHDDVILSGESVDPNDTINLSKALGFRPQQNTPEGGLELSMFRSIWEH